MLFKEIIGHHELKQQFIKNINEGRISHAQLFYGTEGNAALPMAIAYAQYLNCEDRKQFDSCGTCPSCLKYEQLAHPDLHFFYPVNTTNHIKKDPSSKLFLQYWRELFFENKYFGLKDWYEKIDLKNKQGIINANDCNEIIRILGLKNFESKYKVLIIWMAEKIFYSAAPKILKSLEEPPENTLFILISENPELILKTIISRLQLIKIPRIKESDLIEGLVQKFKIPKEEISKIVKRVEFNITEAIRIIKNEKENDVFVIFKEWFKNCYYVDIIKLCDWIENMSDLGVETLKNVFIKGLEIINYTLNYQVLGKENSFFNYLNEDEKNFIVGVSNFIDIKDLSKFTEIINNGIYHLERNCIPKFVLMDMSFEIIKIIKKKSS